MIVARFVKASSSFRKVLRLLLGKIVFLLRKMTTLSAATVSLSSAESAARRQSLLWQPTLALEVRVGCQAFVEIYGERTRRISVRGYWRRSAGRFETTTPPNRSRTERFGFPREHDKHRLADLLRLMMIADVMQRRRVNEVKVPRHECRKCLFRFATHK